MFLLFFILLFFTPVFASEYGVYAPDNYKIQNVQNEKILFILDFSNSMSEYWDGKRKVDVMIETIQELLPKISRNTSIGLRVYGHRGGLTAFDACKASTLMVPLGGSYYDFNNALVRVNPRGMTPITYSLKQAVKNDFMGFRGNKRIILLTDGGENCDESPCDYVMELVKVRKDVNIDVIALGIEDEEDLDQLRCTALVTTGKFYTANTVGELSKSLKDSVNVRKKVNALIIKND